MGEKMTTVKMSKRTRDRIAQFGVAGESLETAIERILEIAEKEKQKQNPLEAVLAPACA